MKQTLINRYLAGETTISEERELKQLLLDIPAAQQSKAERSILELLSFSESEEVEEDIFAVDYTEEYDKHVRPSRPIRLWPWIAAACVAALLIVFLAPPREEAMQVAKIEDVKMEQSEPILLEDTQPVQVALVAGEKIEPTPVDKSKDIVVKKNITIIQVAKVESSEETSLLAEETSEPVKVTVDIFDATLANVRRAALEKIMSCDLDCMNENIKCRGNRLAALINEQ